jgi:hypothetical protein
MITLAVARRIIDAAEKKAEEIKQPMNIAVVDAGGNLVAHVRMDKAWVGSIDISIKKAWTARAFDISTKELAELSQSGDQFFGIHASNEGRQALQGSRYPGRAQTQSRKQRRARETRCEEGCLAQRQGRLSGRFLPSTRSTWHYRSAFRHALDIASPDEHRPG